MSGLEKKKLHKETALNKGTATKEEGRGRDGKAPPRGEVYICIPP